MSFRVSISISTLLLPPSNPEPWDGRQMCVSNSTASQAPPGSVGWERHYCNECSFQPVLTGQCFSPYMTKKKCTNFLPSSVPPQEDKSQSFFPFYTKRPPRNPNPPLAFSTSFQSHEKHQLTFPLHQPNQSIQLSIFLTPNKLSSSPASGSPPAGWGMPFAKVSGQACAMKGSHKNKTQALSGRLTVILLLCCLPCIPSRQRQPTFPTIPLGGQLWSWDEGRKYFSSKPVLKIDGSRKL